MIRSNKAVRYSGESSRTTHGAAACIDACRYFGGLLFSALAGASKEELLSPCLEPFCPEIAEIAQGSFQKKNPPKIRGTGYVVKSLEAALWAFHHSHDFRSGCLLAANLGDDADTTAAIYGQIAGAYYGSESIPANWRQRLALRETIENLSRMLCYSSTLRG